MWGVMCWTGEKGLQIIAVVGQDKQGNSVATFVCYDTEATRAFSCPDAHYVCDTDVEEK